MAAAKSLICIGCWQDMRHAYPHSRAALHSLQAVGSGISQMNPNLSPLLNDVHEVSRQKQIVILPRFLVCRLAGYTPTCLKSVGETPGPLKVLQSLSIRLLRGGVGAGRIVLTSSCGGAILAIFGFRSCARTTRGRPCWRHGDPEEMAEEPGLMTTDEEGQSHSHRAVASGSTRPGLHRPRWEPPTRTSRSSARRQHRLPHQSAAPPGEILVTRGIRFIRGSLWTRRLDLPAQGILLHR